MVWRTLQFRTEMGEKVRPPLCVSFTTDRRSLAREPGQMSGWFHQISVLSTETEHTNYASAKAASDTHESVMATLLNRKKRNNLRADKRGGFF